MTGAKTEEVMVFLLHRPVLFISQFIKSVFSFIQLYSLSQGEPLSETFFSIKVFN